MSSVSFDLCIYPDSTGFNFIDTTGRQPDQPNGYLAAADLTLYTSTLTWIGKDDVQLTQVTPDVTESSIEQPFSVQIPDGFYEVTYAVRDEANALVGECTIIALIDKDYTASIFSLLAEANRCNRCRHEIIDTVSDALSHIKAATRLAEGGDIKGAHILYCEAIRVIKIQTCKC